MAAYEALRSELEDELQRRKDLGAKYQAVLVKIQAMEQNDETAREDHQVIRVLGVVSLNNDVKSINNI